MDTEEVIDRLYGLPLAKFTGARNEAASELRKAGEPEAAARVKALRKPTAVAAAVNRLVREHRGEVERFLRAAVVLRDAQFGGEGELAAATKQEREELERLTSTGGEAVRQTLLAAAADDDAARQLLEGRLERELELRGFGTLLANARPAAARSAGPAAATTKRALPEKGKPDKGAARARLQDARAALSAAETEERHNRGRWEQAQKDLAKARATAEKAQAAVEHAQKDLEKARAAVEKAQHELDRLHGR